MMLPAARVVIVGSAGSADTSTEHAAAAAASLRIADFFMVMFPLVIRTL